MSNGEQSETIPPRPKGLPADGKYAQGKWYYLTAESTYREYKDPAELVKQSVGSTGTDVEQRKELKLTVRGDAVDVFERLANMAMGVAPQGRPMPSERLVYNPSQQAVVSEEESLRARHQAYLAAQRAQKEKASLLAIESSASDEDVIDAEIEEDDVDVEADTDTAPIDTQDEGNDTSGNTVVTLIPDLKTERRGLKRLRNFGIIAVALAYGGIVLGHFANDARDAQDICSPAGMIGVGDILANPDCYGDELKDSFADGTNYLPWGE